MLRLIPLFFFVVMVIFACDTKKVTAPSSTDAPMTDSAKVALVLNNLLEACYACSPDANCSKVAPYIVYRGKTEPDRAWKTLIDYSKEEDREIVNQACIAIKKVLPEGTKFRIKEFSQERESEGVWNVLVLLPDAVSSNGKQRHIDFAFLEIQGEYALGDIDSYTYR
ncbi:MAG: hypothetical protein AAF502_02145 [Bacteroidota bacterium]